MAHNVLNYFGCNKNYALLCDSHYWTCMHHNLYKFYVPGCDECQQNKGCMACNGKGPLHPLPVPESRCDSIAMDFIGPLPLEQNCDCILSITDHLNSDLKIILTWIDITAPQLARIFFDH